MNRANDIWRLARDVLLTVGGLGLLYLAALGLVPQSIAPMLVPGSFALLGAPYALRRDERKRRERDEED